MLNNYVCIFSATISKSCTQSHKLSPYLSTDSSLITSYSLIK